MACPFRKTSLKGWLGGDKDPDDYLLQLDFKILACHSRVPYDENLTEELSAKHPCIGALQFMNNSAKKPRRGNTPLYKKVLESETSTNEEVFQWPHDFIKHHSK